MAKPWLHSVSSAKRYGGKPEDYLPLHNHMDATKGCMADNRHRALTHNSWYVSAGGPLELIFGVNLTNSDGKSVSVRDLGEQHILEDFGNRFIPTPQDYLQEMEYRPWMTNGAGVPPSNAKINANKRTVRKIDFD